MDPRLQIKALEMIVLPTLTAAFHAGQMDVINSQMLSQLLAYPPTPSEYNNTSAAAAAAAAAAGTSSSGGGGTTPGQGSSMPAGGAGGPGASASAGAVSAAAAVAVPHQLHEELLKLTCLCVRYYGRRLPESVTKYVFVRTRVEGIIVQKEN